MPPNSECYRANVDRSSEEFRDLEKLFGISMNDYTVRIENIDRVQNLFMMEKYCRWFLKQANIAKEEEIYFPYNYNRDKPVRCNMHGTFYQCYLDTWRP